MEAAWLLTQVNGEGSPLGRRSVEVAVLDMQITCGYSLRAQSVEQCHFGTASDAHCGREAVVRGVEGGR